MRKTMSWNMYGEEDAGAPVRYVGPVRGSAMRSFESCDSLLRGGAQYE